MTETQPQTRHLGYARVSTYGQTLEAQLAQLKAQGCSKIYREKASGAQSDRRELLKLLKAIAPSDVVTMMRSSASIGCMSSFCGSSHRPSLTIWFSTCPACASSFSDLRSIRSAMPAMPRGTVSVAPTADEWLVWVAGWIEASLAGDSPQWRARARDHWL